MFSPVSVILFMWGGGGCRYLWSQVLSRSLVPCPFRGGLGCLPGLSFLVSCHFRLGWGVTVSRVSGGWYPMDSGTGLLVHLVFWYWPSVIEPSGTGLLA